MNHQEGIIFQEDQGPERESENFLSSSDFITLTSVKFACFAEMKS